MYEDVCIHGMKLIGCIHAMVECPENQYGCIEQLTHLAERYAAFVTSYYEYLDSTPPIGGTIGGGQGVSAPTEGSH